MGLRFVGHERLAIVDDLSQIWQRCEEEKTAHLVLLEGHPGVGKTRIVQEFYERLQRDQPEPAYWPPLLDDENSPILSDRGRIRPLTFAVPPGAKPSFAWVAISCRLDEESGVPARALIDAVGASEELLSRVLDPMGRRRRLFGQLWRISMVLIGLVIAILGLVDIGGLWTIILGIAVSITGVIFEAREQIERTHEELERFRREHTHSDILIDAASVLEDASLGANARASGFLKGLAQHGVPGVVIIDDAHWADEDTVNLVDALLERALPTLIIATVRPVPFDDQVETRTHMGRIARDFGPVLTWIHIDTLSSEELIEAIQARGPRTDLALAEVIAEHAGGNPLVLGGTLDQPVLRRSLHAGGYELAEPASTLGAFSTDPRGVFEDYWQQLGVESQQTIAVATVHGQLVQPDFLDVGCKAALGEESLSASDAIRGAQGWLVAVDEGLDRFADPVLYEVGRRHVASVVSAAELDRARQAMVDELLAGRNGASPMWLRLSPEARRVVLRIHVSAARSGVVEAGHEAARSALEIANLADGPAEATMSLEVARLALGWGEGDERVCEEASWVSSKRLRELGQSAEAIELLEPLVERRRSSLGEKDPKVLEARGALAGSLREAGRLDEAAESYHDLIPVAEEVNGANNLATLGLRRDLAMVLKDLGRYDEALDLLHHVAADLDATVGPDHPDTLQTRSELAVALGETGKLPEALEVFRDVVDRQTATLGEDSPQTLLTRNGLAVVLRFSGRHLEAEEEHNQILALRLRILGPDHPDTLRSRSNLITAIWAGGDLERALVLSEALLADRVRALGPDHQDTMRSRNNMMVVLSGLGRYDEAARMQRELITDLERLLGPDHPDTLRSRGNLASVLEASGDYESAGRELESLLKDSERVLGAEHPDTLITRRDLAELRAARGDLDGSLQELAVVLETQLRILGAENPETFETQVAEAKVLIALDRSDDARALLRSVLDQQERILGSSHPAAEETRRQLAGIESGPTVGG